MGQTEEFSMETENSLVKYDSDIFGAFEVTGVISNTQNGIIYESRRRTNDNHLVIKQVSKKSVRNYYVIHGQPCPAEFVYHFTASAKNNKYIIQPHEWIEGRCLKKFRLIFREITLFIMFFGDLLWILLTRLTHINKRKIELGLENHLFI